MLFAGLAASTAIDLLSLLQPEKAQAKGGTSLTAKSSFSLAEQGPVETAQAQPQSQATVPQTGNLSRDALDTLLSAQGQEAAKRKKKSTSVLLDLLQSKGSVKKSEFETEIGEGGSDKASELFDKIDQDRDGSINTAEMSLYLNTYKRNADAKAAARARALAVA